MSKVGVNDEPLLERLIFGFDGTNYRVVKIDTDGNLVAALKASQVIEVTQPTPADLQATVTLAAAQEIEVTQPTAADLQATVTLAASQTIEATQDTYADLKASVENVPRMPPGVTDLSDNYELSLANNSYCEMLSKTNATTSGGCSGRTVANGKRLAIAWASSSVNSTSGTVAMYLVHGSTNVLVQIGASPNVVFNPAVVWYMVGDGSKVWKIITRNVSGSTNGTKIAAQVWEEDVP